MKHKHSFQFVEECPIPCVECKKLGKTLPFWKLMFMPRCGYYHDSRYKVKFVCECGKIKIVVER